MTGANIIEIFCILDEFCKYFAPKLKKHTLDTSGKRRRNLPCLMSDSEVMIILVLFHTMRQRDLKSFYLGYVCNHMCTEFPHRLSYNRFIERQVKVGLYLLLFLQTCALGKCTGISIIGSTPLKSCNIKRAHSHRTMKGWAAKGKCMYGYENKTIIDCSCTLLEPHKGYTDGEVVWDYGKEIVVRLINSKEVVRSRDDVLIFD